MKIKRSVHHFFTRKITIAKWQFNLALLVAFNAGIIFAFVYLANQYLIPKIFAASSPWTQTDWSGGQSASTATGTVTTYSAKSNTDPTTSAGNITLSLTSGWYNSSWKYRRKITIDNTTATLGVTSETLTNFPILVKLTSSNIDYANTQNSGQDIRFTDSDGSTLLSHEIELWDESGTSYVWVKVPSIDINSNTDYIYAYYGNSSASDAQAATSVWDSNYKMVQHLNETGNGTADEFTDSTSNASHGQGVGVSNQTASGKVDGAQVFDGTDDNISISNNASVTGATAFTIEGWLNPSSLPGGGTSKAAYFEASPDEGFSRIYYGITQNGSFCSGTKMFIRVRTESTTATPICSSTTPTTSTWYHFVATIDTANNLNKVYVNGALETTDTTDKGTVSTSATYSNPRIGAYYNGSSLTEFFPGSIDEFRVSTSARSAGWIKAEYLNMNGSSFASFGSQEERYPTSGTLISNIFDSNTGGSIWGTMTFNKDTSNGGTATVSARTSNSSTMVGATDFSQCASITSGSDISGASCVTDGDRYIQYQVTLTAGSVNTPTFQDISIAFTPYDNTAPPTNASSIIMSTASSDGHSVASNGWNNASQPYFTWTAGADDTPDGSGLKGYCLYLGTDSSADPGTAKGVLGTSPVSISGSTCQFIVSSNNLNLTTSGYLGSALSSGTTYYLLIKAIDNANNIYTGSAASFHFRQDATAPTNVAYISAASGSFGSVTDMNFSWPTSGAAAAADNDAGVLGWQYQLNSSSGTWQGTTHDDTLNLDYIPATASAYTFINGRDSSAITTGTNVIYFRTVDTAGNTSASSTYRTASIAYGGAAPTFSISCESTSGITITPSSSDTNSFALSWSAATPGDGRTVAKYYYMINTSPPSSLSTITSNDSQYISAGTATSVSAGVLTGSVRGSNTVYVVVVDDADNYSSSNCIKGTYTLSSTNPNPPLNLAATDASIKASSLWRASLGWDVPSYKGTGSLTYKIQRSTDNETWTNVATTTGTSYIDTVASSQKYYWRVGTYDTSSQSQADPSYATAVSITPKGTYTDAASLSSGPTVSSVTTKKAKITWSTSRASDSKIQYGTKSGDYFTEEPSNSTQTTDHTINLTSLSPGTTYYYKAKWTDEDGNTGASSEKSFSTDAKPSIKEAVAKNVGLTSVTLQFVSVGASKVKIYYGKSTAFGATKEVSTSTSETTNTTLLEELEDGTKYYYRINTFDTDGTEYEGDTNSFETLPRPKISNVRIQQVANTAQSTIYVTWNTNTEVSSIVTYYPDGNPGGARDEVAVALVKGEHKMFLRGLLPETSYILIVKGKDKAGNEASSDTQRVTTAIDTRPPQISGLNVEGTNIPPVQGTGQEPTSQLVVSWTTDEPATSQVEFGEGTGSTYAQKTQEDANLTFNHLVIISGLTPSKVYHLRALSKDKASNGGKSIDTVTITPKSTGNALNLVISNLQQVFGIFGGLGQ